MDGRRLLAGFCAGRAGNHPGVTKLGTSDRKSRGFLTRSKEAKRRRRRGGCFSETGRRVAAPCAQGEAASLGCRPRKHFSPASSFPEEAWLRALRQGPLLGGGCGASGKALGSAAVTRAARDSHLFLPALAPGFSPHLPPWVLSSSTRNCRGAGPGPRTHLPGWRRGAVFAFLTPSTLPTSQPWGLAPRDALTLRILGAGSQWAHDLNACP